MKNSPFDGAFSVNGLYLSGAFFYLFQVAGMVRPFVSVGFHTSCGYGNPDQIFCSGFGQSRFDPESMFFTGVHCSAFTPPLIVIYNPQIQISAESETKRSIFREKDKTKRSKKESAQHSKSRNKSFVMTSVSAL